MKTVYEKNVISRVLNTKKYSHEKGTSEKINVITRKTLYQTTLYREFTVFKDRKSRLAEIDDIKKSRLNKKRNNTMGNLGIDPYSLV